MRCPNSGGLLALTAAHALLCPDHCGCANGAHCCAFFKFYLYLFFLVCFASSECWQKGFDSVTLFVLLAVALLFLAVKIVVGTT